MADIPQYLKTIIQVMKRENIRSITIIHSDGTEQTLEQINALEDLTETELENYIQLALFDDRMN